MRGFFLERLKSELDKLNNSEPGEIDFEHIFDITPDLIFILDTECNILCANDALAKRLRKSSHDLIGSKCYLCIHPANEPSVDCPHSQMIKDGREHTEEMFSELFNGWFPVAVKPLKDVQNNDRPEQCLRKPVRLSPC